MVIRYQLENQKSVANKRAVSQSDQPLIVTSGFKTTRWQLRKCLFWGFQMGHHYQWVQCLNALAAAKLFAEWKSSNSNFFIHKGVTTSVSFIDLIWPALITNGLPDTAPQVFVSSPGFERGTFHLLKWMRKPLKVWSFLSRLLLFLMTEF